MTQKTAFDEEYLLILGEIRFYSTECRLNKAIRALSRMAEVWEWDD